MQSNKGPLEWQQIACGDCHTVGVNREGDLVSQGWGENGQLGHGSNHDYRTEPQIIDKALFSKKIKLVACGEDHTCVLTPDGELYSW